MVVEAEAGVERKPTEQVLAEVYIAGNLVLMGVAHRVEVSSRGYHTVPSLAVNVLIINSYGNPVAVEERRALVYREACKGVV